MRSECLLREVDEKALDQVDREKVLHRYRARQVVFHEGTPPLAVYCIRSGMVKLYRAGRRGEEIVLRVLMPGDAFGYRPLLCGEPYAASAEVIEPADVCVIPRQTLIDVLRSGPAFALDLLARLARELRASEDQLHQLTQKTVLQRAAGLLVMLAESRGEAENGGIRIAIPIQRKEMAHMIGTTPETFSRTLRELSLQGALVLSRSDIVVTDSEALRRLASA
jgi:CRP/FNR family transcriptional regulator